MRDQAERLRQMAERMRDDQPAPVSRGRRARVIAVSSGKGGVGKTNVSVNLSYALLALGHQVTVLDADLGLANVDVLLGTLPKYHMGHAVAGTVDILDLLYDAPNGLKLIAGGSGIDDLADLPEPELSRFIHSLRRLEGHTDFLLVDTAAGLGKGVTNFLLAADTVLIVTNPEPTAMTDAYALIKVLARKNPSADIKLIVNQAQTRTEGEEAANRLRTTVLRFLGSSIEFLGAIPHDKEVLRCVRNQQPFLLAAPECAASRAVKEMARKLTGEHENPRAAVGLFFDRLVRTFARKR